ncbi:uncharacterized protein MELLADRAFT_88082 [Melampsora larici-populina 98AG31]|uniref:Secreted protein n=1 Tax=Melampsora larici-populina (strain 98AG31 / pathotype 3-4-7) TaxID=747676 RepID=F4RQD5_MELLP|nr:uncharacterized protein MELLADRAFT_88082 [Melampsora larici-populina 98AG31]EGG05388.1 hypothetical protein MELLADRAFT_88082 [Melampsora larici-populina 98AG31]
MSITNFILCALLLWSPLVLVDAKPASSMLAKRGIFHVTLCVKQDAAQACKDGWSGCCTQCCKHVVADDMPGTANREDWNDACECHVAIDSPPAPVSTPPVIIPPPAIITPTPPAPPPASNGSSSGWAYSVANVTLTAVPVAYSGAPPPGTTTYYVHNPVAGMANQAYFVTGLNPGGPLSLTYGPPPPDTIIYYVPNPTHS